MKKWEAAFVAKNNKKFTEVQKTCPLSYNNSKAFSLVELSVVAIVVGMLITGVIKGSGLVRSSRIANARSYTAKSIVPEIKNLVAWYETSMIDSFDKGDVVDETQISKWYDINPSSNVGSNKQNILEKTAGSGVIYTINGINDIPSLAFSAGEKISLSDFFQGASVQNTILIVFRPYSSPSSTLQVITDSGSSGSNSSIGIKNNAVNLNAGTSSDTQTSTYPASLEVDNDYVLCVYFNGASSQVFLNDATNRIGDSAISAGDNALKGLTIGSYQNGSSPFSGLISEVIIYNTVLTLQERKDVMNYLAKKYKISVNGI